MSRETESTNRNYLVISGGDDWTLSQCCGPFGFGERPDVIVFALHIHRGCIQLGPEDTDPMACVILACGRRDNPNAWSLIDYREAVTDAELEARMKALSDQLPSMEVRNRVKIESTQDVDYRDKALRKRS